MPRHSRAERMATIRTFSSPALLIALALFVSEARSVAPHASTNPDPEQRVGSGPIFELLRRITSGTPLGVYSDRHAVEDAQVQHDVENSADGLREPKIAEGDLKEEFDSSGKLAEEEERQEHNGGEFEAENVKGENSDAGTDTPDNTSSENAVLETNDVSIESMANQLSLGLLTKGKEFFDKAKKEGKSPMAALRQIFPFNPYIAYGPALTIPLWILMGMYVKLLKKTKEFYSSAYRIDFWKKKPFGLKGYYLHPAYYPVERVPNYSEVPHKGYGSHEHKHEVHTYGMSGEKDGDAIVHEEYGVENTYNLPPDVPLYVDEDAVLPPLSEDLEEYLQNADVLRRRTGAAAVNSRLRPPSRPGQSRRKEENPVQPVFKGVSAGSRASDRVGSATASRTVRRKRNRPDFAKRFGSPVPAVLAGGLESARGTHRPHTSNLPWTVHEKRVASTTTQPALPLQKLFAGKLADGVQPTTWRPPFTHDFRKNQAPFSPVSIPWTADDDGGRGIPGGRTDRYNHGVK